MKNKKENIDLVNIIFNLRIYTERVKRYNSGSPIFGDTFKSLKSQFIIIHQNYEKITSNKNMYSKDFEELEKLYFNRPKVIYNPESEEKYHKTIPPLCN